MSDDAVVAAAKEHDPEAWRALYRAHAGRLVVWLSTRAGGDSAISAEDLAADTWLTAATKLDDFSGSSHDFGGWLFGIARNLAANNRRRDARRGTDPVAEVPDRAGEGVDHAVVHAAAERERVRALLAHLPPRERDVVACLEVVGLDVAQTAAALRMTPVAVRVARHRGLRRLRTAVGGSDVADGRAVASDPAGAASVATL